MSTSFASNALSKSHSIDIVLRISRINMDVPNYNLPYQNTNDSLINLNTQAIHETARKDIDANISQLAVHSFTGSVILNPTGPIKDHVIVQLKINDNEKYAISEGQNSLNPKVEQAVQKILEQLNKSRKRKYDEEGDVHSTSTFGQEAISNKKKTTTELDNFKREIFSSFDEDIARDLLMEPTVQDDFDEGTARDLSMEVETDRNDGSVIDCFKEKVIVGIERMLNDESPPSLGKLKSIQKIFSYNNEIKEYVQSNHANLSDKVEKLIQAGVKALFCECFGDTKGEDLSSKFNLNNKITPKFFEEDILPEIQRILGVETGLTYDLLGNIEVILSYNKEIEDLVKLKYPIIAKTVTAHMQNLESIGEKLYECFGSELGKDIFYCLDVKMQFELDVFKEKLLPGINSILSSEDPLSFNKLNFIKKILIGNNEIKEFITSNCPDLNNRIEKRIQNELKQEIVNCFGDARGQFLFDQLDPKVGFTPEFFEKYIIPEIEHMLQSESPITFQQLWSIEEIFSYNDKIKECVQSKYAILVDRVEEHVLDSIKKEICNCFGDARGKVLFDQLDPKIGFTPEFFEKYIAPEIESIINARDPFSLETLSSIYKICSYNDEIKECVESNYVLKDLKNLFLSFKKFVVDENKSVDDLRTMRDIDEHISYESSEIYVLGGWIIKDTSGNTEEIKREYIAYRLSKGNLFPMPFSVYMKLKFNREKELVPVFITKFIFAPDPVKASQAAVLSNGLNENELSLQKILLYDLLFANTDRHDDNIIYGKLKTENGIVQSNFAIDNASCMRPDDKRIGPNLKCKLKHPIDESLYTIFSKENIDHFAKVMKSNDMPTEAICWMKFVGYFLQEVYINQNINQASCEKVAIFLEDNYQDIRKAVSVIDDEEDKAFEAKAKEQVENFKNTHIK